MAWRASTNSAMVTHPMGTKAIGLTWDPCTVVAIVRVSALYTDQVPLLAAETSGGSHRGHLYLLEAGNNQLAFWDGSQFMQSGVSIVVAPADGWTLCAMTRSTATGAIWFHKYVYNTNTWVQTNGLQSAGSPSTAAGAGGKWFVNRQTAYPDSLDGGDIAAVAYIPRYLSDSEVRSLARGDWWRYSSIFHREFQRRPASGHNFGSDGATVDSAVTDFTASPVPDPPGFRFSPLNRRR